MKVIAIGIGIVALIVVIVVFATWLITITWGWVVPDVFSGMVEHGLLPASITFLQAFKLTLLLGFLGLTNRASASKSS